MMITLHGDRGKQKAETKAQELSFHHPLCSTSLRSQGETAWVRGFVAAYLALKCFCTLYTVHARAAKHVHTSQAKSPMAC